MNFNAIYQLIDKRKWWVDVVFYFVISLLIALVVCYFIFWIKISFQQKQINDFKIKLESVGTDEQKGTESEVFTYQKKISDYATLVGNHQSVLNVFSFLESYTLPNVWISRYSLSESSYQAVMTGEASDMQTLSAQISTFEQSQYVKKIDLLSSSAGQAGRVNYNMNLALDPKLFAYVAQPPPEQAPEVQANPQPQTQPQNNPSQNPVQTQNQTPGLSSNKLITAFDLPLNPEVQGQIDQTNHTILLSVPAGTDVKTLSPAVYLSPDAQVSPASDIPQDFSNPVVYTVKAQDLSAQDYTVTVSVAKPPAPKKSSAAGIILGLVAILVLAGGGALGWFYFKKYGNR